MPCELFISCCILVIFNYGVQRFGSVFITIKKRMTVKLECSIGVRWGMCIVLTVVDKMVKDCAWHEMH